MRLRIALVPLLAAAAACTTSPITGRAQLILLDAQTEFRLGRQGYQQILAEAKVSHDPVLVAPVQRVGPRIARAAEELARERGLTMPFDWDWHVLHEPETANAFCLPGGRIGVYSGLYPVVQDEDGLAVILGHEVAHALLRHGNERVSQQIVAQVGAVVLAVGLRDKDPVVLQGALAAYGLGAQVGVLLPYNRAQEAEADRWGLMLAARAGYDPRAGPVVWRRMSQRGGGRLPEILSTHPAPERRMRDMEAWLPEALAVFAAAPRAEVAQLPDPRSRPWTSGGAASVAGTAGRVWRTAHGLSFEFTLERDALVRRLEVEGPRGYREVLEPQAPVEGQVAVVAEVGAPRPLLAGRYQLRVSGAASGRPFETVLLYDLR